jgi:hypothetical protein
VRGGLPALHADGSSIDPDLGTPLLGNPDRLTGRPRDRGPIDAGRVARDAPPVGADLPGDV